MKNILFIIISIIVLSCADKKSELINPDKYYFLNHSQNRTSIDTSYIDSLWFRIDTTMQKVYAKNFNEKFSVVKYAMYGGPVDSQMLFYWTNDFGIIYYKNIAWGGFSRLHCTNDSIEKILNSHCDFILSSQSLVISGEDFAQYGETKLRLGDIRMNLKK